MNKTRLQELCHKHRWDLPQYTARQVEAVREPRFAASVTVNDRVYESPDAESRSVKEAQNKAAAVAFDALSAALAAAPAPVPPPMQSPAADESASAPQPPPTECHATFKSQLQIYAQKKCKELPKYTSVSVGPPHARQFKATVVIDGLTFECPRFFRTAREAEHAAAEVALANLPKEESSEQNLQDEGVVSYKTLLQVYMQKHKHLLPVYTTVNDPDSSLPLFLSTVEVCGRTFKGVASRTKKQAEASAAKVALDNLEEQNRASAAQESKPLPANPTQELEILPANPVSEEIQITKDCNLDSAAHSNMNLTVKSSYSEGLASTGSEESHDEWVESSLIGNKVHVYPLHAGLALPDGAIRLPFSDNTWVAAILDFP